MKKVFGMSVLVLAFFAVLTVVALAAPSCFDIIGSCIDVGNTYMGSDYLCKDDTCYGSSDGPDGEYAYYCDEWYCSGQYRYNNRTYYIYCGHACANLK